MVSTRNFKIESSKKIRPKDDKEVKPGGGNILKSAMVVPRTQSIKESFVSRPLSQRYAQLPSLRYGATPNVTATQMLGSGPLRVSVRIENDVIKSEANKSQPRRSMLRYNRRYSSLEVNEIDNGCRNSSVNMREMAAPTTIRRVRFADLPPKCTDSVLDSEERGDKQGNEGDDVIGGEDVEQWMRNRIGLPTTNDITITTTSTAGDIRNRSSTVELRSRVKPSTNRNSTYVTESFCKLPNYSLSKSSSDVFAPVVTSKNKYNTNSNTSVGRIHDTARYKKGTLPPTAGSPSSGTIQLTPLLRAAKLGDENEIGDILRRCLSMGISAEDINAVDNSGRTAVSYIASNGNLSHLETVLQIEGIDINKGDNEGNTPLHFAAQAGQMEVVNYLLSRCTDLDIDARNALGFTPLMKAALQGRTKCAKLLLFAGASPILRDYGRGFRAEQWARFCGRYVCAEVIEKFSRTKLLDRNTTHGRWGSEPELAARAVTGKCSTTSNTPSGMSIKSKIRKAFRTTSHPGPEPHQKPPFSIVSQLTNAALCASSPVLPSSQKVQQSIKSLIRPLSVPKLQVTLAATSKEDVFDSAQTQTSAISSNVEPVVKDRPPTARPNTTKKKKK